MTGGPDRAGKPATRTPRGLVDWIFRDRKTGRIVIAQFPNIPLAVWIVATVLGLVTHGTIHTIVRILGSLALAIWAGTEIISSVNPWRRFLGAAVLVGLAVSVWINA